LLVEFLSQRRVHVPFISRARQSGCMNKVSEEHKRLYSQLPSSLKPAMVLLMHVCSYAHRLSTHVYSACQQEVLLSDSSYKKFLQTYRYAPSCVKFTQKCESVAVFNSLNSCMDRFYTGMCCLANSGS